LKDFEDGKRPATIMHQIAKGFTDEQLEVLAAYFAAQKAPR
jgi:sulfide dehydrogenase cytochrome subunit